MLVTMKFQKVLTDVTRGVPIVSLRQQRTELLGPPYSEPGFSNWCHFCINSKL